MRAVSTDQRRTPKTNGGGEYGPVFLRQPVYYARITVCSRCRHDIQSFQQGVQNSDAIGRLCREIPASLFDDIAIRAALMPGLQKPLHQFRDCTVGFGRGKKHIRIEENPHATGLAGALLLAAQKTIEIRLSLVKLANALFGVHFHRERDRRAQ